MEECLYYCFRRAEVSQWFWTSLSRRAFYRSYVIRDKHLQCAIVIIRTNLDAINTRPNLNKLENLSKTEINYVFRFKYRMNQSWEAKMKQEDLKCKALLLLFVCASASQLVNKSNFYTPPIPEIIWVYNVRAIVVCGFLIKSLKKYILKIWKKSWVPLGVTY